MRALRLGLALAFALPVAACASSAPPAAAVTAKPADAPPLPRSSIAAVVLRRAEIGLSDEQVGEMEQIDQKREAEDAAAREELDRERKQAQSAAPAGGGGGGGSSASRGMHGGGMGGGMRGGGMHGGGMGGRPAAAASGGAKRTDRQGILEDRLDDNDTKAYLDAEELLTDAQKGPAREIASDYRERLYQEREIARSKSAATK
jgi:hypothetical protein